MRLLLACEILLLSSDILVLSIFFYFRFCVPEALQSARKNQMALEVIVSFVEAPRWCSHRLLS